MLLLPTRTWAQDSSIVKSVAVVCISLLPLLFIRFGIQEWRRGRKDLAAGYSVSFVGSVLLAFVFIKQAVAGVEENTLSWIGLALLCGGMIAVTLSLLRSSNKLLAKAKQSQL